MYEAKTDTPTEEYYMDKFYYILNNTMSIRPVGVSASSLELLYPQRIRQVRKSKNDCVLSQSQIQNWFPYLQNEWSDVFSNDYTSKSYQGGIYGFEFESGTGRAVSWEMGDYNYDGYSLIYVHEPSYNISDGKPFSYSPF